MNTKSTICRNWAKSLKLYNIVQILVMSFDTSIIAENDLEHLVSLCTRSALHHRIRSDNTTILQFLCIIRKLPNNRFDLCKSHPLNNRYSYKSLCRPNVPARAKFHLQLGYTVIPLSKANYPTNYGFIHTMNPTQPTTLLTESPNTFTTVNWWKHPTYALSSWQQVREKLTAWSSLEYSQNLSNIRPGNFDKSPDPLSRPTHYHWPWPSAIEKNPRQKHQIHHLLKNRPGTKTRNTLCDTVNK